MGTFNLENTTGIRRFFSPTLRFVNQGAPKEEGHATQQNDLQKMPWGKRGGRRAVFFLFRILFLDENPPSWKKGMKIRIVAGNENKEYQIPKKQQQFQTCLVLIVCKKCSQKLFPQPTCGELKCDNPTPKHKNSSNEAQHTC